MLRNPKRTLTLCIFPKITVNDDDLIIADVILVPFLHSQCLVQQSLYQMKGCHIQETRLPGFDIQTTR